MINTCLVTICTSRTIEKIDNVKEIYINDTDKFNICAFNVEHLETFLIRKVDRYYYVDIHNSLHVAVY